MVVTDAAGGMDATPAEVGESAHSISDRFGKYEIKQITCSRKTDGGCRSRSG